jgi:2-polyprenyl-3-methyl-5-hydroxy-6-metoxy-1,4-benzoquinol methylase
MEIHFEEINYCCLCDSQDAEPLAINKDRFYKLPGVFVLMKCRSCKMVRLSPRPTKDSIAFYYPEHEYYSFRIPNITSKSKLKQSLMPLLQSIRDAELRSLGYYIEDRWIAPGFVSNLLPKRVKIRAVYGYRQFPKYLKNGRALDIGCGNGYFLSLLKKHGWSVEGVEVSETAAKNAEAAFGVTVHVGSLEDLAFKSRSYDFINMSHVIEHVYDPVALLKKVAKLLAPGGVLYVETPNINSAGFKVCRELWFPLETPRHLWLFCPETLNMALSSAGLKVTKLTTVGFKDIVSWYNTYKNEDLTGQILTKRPSLSLSLLPKSIMMALKQRTIRTITPQSGEIICCWATISQ